MSELPPQDPTIQEAVAAAANIVNGTAAGAMENGAGGASTEVTADQYAAAKEAHGPADVDGAMAYAAGKGEGDGGTAAAREQLAAGGGTEQDAATMFALQARQTTQYPGLATRPASTPNQQWYQGPPPGVQGPTP